MVNQHLLTQPGTGFKNPILLFGATMVFAAMLAIAAMAGSGTANADATEAAVVINEFGCFNLDGDGNPAWASNGHSEITHNWQNVVSESGNSTLTCLVPWGRGRGSKEPWGGNANVSRTSPSKVEEQPGPGIGPGPIHLSSLWSSKGYVIKLSHPERKDADSFLCPC